jgi:hypothetical protein
MRLLLGLDYPTSGTVTINGRPPKARPMLTETTSIQDKLTQFFHLDRYAPRPVSTCQNVLASSMIIRNSG